MSYATLADMIDRYGREEIETTTPDRDSPRGTLDEARVSRILSDASSTVDSYLQRRYVVPIQPVPPVVVRICCQLARFDLANGGSNVPSEQIRAGQQAAMAWLRDVVAGKATLDAVAKVDQSDDWSRFQSRSTFHSREGFSYE
ncbi:DUF1320 domain-containing protein [Saccharibacter sp. 17.LH.SD]|uniref:DUF1320 domain-containing protein n=1 Tax=Saccharibacter sp. 17.LH.SD TaxID=2689393 RepID=UPI001368DDAC|nr:DUF1320 domain-containing protein [Saccharibacter sp. 17.LH.SD]MXV43910.1 DUF1320 domain-containing protein [Saccharibacter sp. 17.LH.SD]